MISKLELYKADLNKKFEEFKTLTTNPKFFFVTDSDSFEITITSDEIGIETGKYLDEEDCYGVACDLLEDINFVLRRR